jgi:hypothetical protein
MGLMDNKCDDKKKKKNEPLKKIFFLAPNISFALLARVATQWAKSMQNGMNRFNLDRFEKKLYPSQVFIVAAKNEKELGRT